MVFYLIAIEFVDIYILCSNVKRLYYLFQLLWFCVINSERNGVYHQIYLMYKWTEDKYVFNPK